MKYSGIFKKMMAVKSIAHMTPEIHQVLDQNFNPLRREDKFKIKELSKSNSDSIY